MLAILGYCLRDNRITLELFDWIVELGGCRDHDLLLLHDPRCQKDDVAAILGAATAAFRSVKDYEARAAIDGWPQGANYFFRTMSSVASYNTELKHFMWMEPDAIPLKAGWLDTIEREYLSCGQPFMGDRVEVENIPLHMSGVGVYPSPIYNLAGEAYRASDIAWDMAAKDQIVPRAHFTKLIEHAWKHPSFTDPSELTTQIRPEAVLFHASKDGSLIRLLRAKLFPAAPVQADPSCNYKDGEARESTEADPSIRNVPAERRGALPVEQAAITRGGGELSSVKEAAGRPNMAVPRPAVTPTCDIFIRTYPADYPWLKHCLRAINKFCSGFRKVWIVSPQDCPMDCHGPYEWKTINEETEDGYLSQQITKLYADVITDYGADYILHVDSDVLFTRPTTPLDFFAPVDISTSDLKPFWYYTPYSQIKTPWQPVTEKFMGQSVEFEFMRRFPIMVPRWIYPRLREFCHKTHGMVLCDYVKMQPLRHFSEFNAIGAYAYYHHRNGFAWVDTTAGQLPPPLARQFFSWGGITDEVQAEINLIFDGTDKPEAADAPAHIRQSAESVPPTLSVGHHINALINYANQGKEQTKYLRKQLRKYGIIPKTKKGSRAGRVSEVV